MARYLLFAVSENLTDFGSPLAADIDAALHNTATAGGTWLGPGARITRSYDTTVPYPLSLLAPRARLVQVAYPIDFPAPAVRGDGTIAPEDLTASRIRLLTDSAQTQLRAIGAGAFTGAVRVLPYDEALMGSTEFWTGPEARRTATRDNPPPLLGGRDDNPIGPNYILENYARRTTWAALAFTGAFVAILATLAILAERYLRQMKAGRPALSSSSSSNARA